MFFMYARNTALATKKNSRIYYIASKREFLLKTQSTPKHNLQKYVSVAGIYKSFKFSSGVFLKSAQESGALPVPNNTDFDFEITPMGSVNSYLFVIGDDDKNKINIVIKAGSGAVKIYKKNIAQIGG